MSKKKSSQVGVKGTAVVTVNLQHWSNTVVCYDSQMYGFALMDLLPDVPLGHGTKVRVTVELLKPGKPCAVRSHNDGKRCTAK